MKRILYQLSIPLSLITLPLNVAYAQEAPEPYIVSQSIPTETISMEECVIILKNPINDDLVEPSLDSSTVIEETKALLQNLQEKFNNLNVEISQLESGEIESLDWANEQLKLVIEDLYEEYLHFDDEFIYLSDEEQTNLIANHDLVNEWRVYMQEIQAIINQKIADRNQVELEYSQVSYTYNELLKEEEDVKELKKLYNQCQLYAYSSEYLSSDQILLNHESNLNDYIIQMSDYLDKIIAIPYRKVSFEDIYQQFTKQLTSDIELISNKNKIVLDSIALEIYSYAKEINLSDIESLTQQARISYEEDEDLTKYGDRYRELIELKENQWNYIYQINFEAFDKLKNDLTNFLNTGDYTNDNDIQLISDLQSKYQVKLVFFDENNHQWITNSTGTSGYYDQYYYKEFSFDSEINVLDSEIIENLPDELETQSLFDEKANLDETNNDIDVTESMNDKLSSLKEQLSNSRNNTQVKDLSVPKSSSDSKMNKPPKSTNKSKNIELPSTGEKHPLTVGAILLLIFGLLLILTSSYSKRKKKEKSLKIHLD
ncbi:hypothetical protein ACF3NG_05580 [Aerococcaceae bacterium WGS1372]